MSAEVSSAPAKKGRDERLDFFRGMAMFIIFIAHLPGNAWFDYIPARFGFSSAAELFVFCSGFASALAFGRIFVTEGFFAGSKRIVFRIWQVYWAHIGLALVLIAISVIALDLTATDYPARLGMQWLYAHPGEGLLRLMTLRLTPIFLDILPMYLVLLAMIPPVMALARLNAHAAIGGLVLLWIAVQGSGINLSGGQSPGMEWFFNPFAWQLVFFTGFSFGMGWLKPLKLEKAGLFWFCVVLLVLSVPLNFWAFTDNAPWFERVHDWLVPANGKTNFHWPLYLHFLASAYVALVLIEPVRHRLNAIRPVILVGQQALAAFMTSIVCAWVGGMVLDAFGRDALTTALVNLAGCAILIVVAAIAREYKGKGGGQGRRGAEAKAPEPPSASARLAA